MDRLLSMRVFEQVVDEGGFAAAARALDMSPPMVTRLVADLEEHLGARLLQRSTRRVSLTDAGQSYLSRVRNILQEIDDADAMTSSHTTELAGRLRLHAPPVLASYVISPVLAEFRSRYPKIQVDIQVEAVQDPPIENFDITLLGTDNSFTDDVVARKIIEADAILVASPAYLRRMGQPIDPQDLSRHECLRLKRPEEQSNRWRLWRQASPEHAVDVDIQPMLIANHTDTLLRATLDGAGITSVSVDLVAQYINRGDLVRVLSPWIAGHLTLYAAYPSRKFLPQRTRVFLDFLIEQTRQHTSKALETCHSCEP